MKPTFTKKGIQIGETLYPLAEINAKVLGARVKEDDLALLEIEWDGRGFNVFERIAGPRRAVLELASQLEGLTVDFGEIAGKHSEVYGEVERSDMKISTDSSAVLSFLTASPTGFASNHSFILAALEPLEGIIEEIENAEREELNDDELAYEIEIRDRLVALKKAHGEIEAYHENA